MIVSWNWLKQYVSLPESPREFEERLMMAGLNHEETHAVADDLAIDLEVTSNRPERVPTQAPRALDLVFLPGLLAQAAGAPIDDWLAANIWARTQCGGLLESCRAPKLREAYLSHMWADLMEFGPP